MKPKLTKEMKADFTDYWDFWDGIVDLAKELAGKGPDDSLCLPNQMMIASYAANAWFATKKAENPETVSATYRTKRPSRSKAKSPSNPRE